VQKNFDDGSPGNLGSLFERKDCDAHPNNLSQPTA
jgi:hypothetical protein